MICSKSSPLYPFNDWPDVNMFFTMGKGMLKGSVPFVDLLEQKGPYAYLVGGIAYLISHRGFQGYFLFELVSVFFFLFYAYKTIRLYTDRPALWVLPLLCGGIVSAKSFVHGGSLEELSLGIFAYAVYSLLRFLKEEDCGPMPVKTLVLNGMWAGIIFWSKFTLSGLYIVWLAAVALRSAGRRKWKEMLQSVGIFLGVMLATTVPWLIYFGVNGAIRDWLGAYLWDNIFGYAEWGGEGSPLHRIGAAVGNIISSLKDRENRTYSFFVALGALTCVCCPARILSWKEKAALAFMGLAMGIGIFIGETKHDYYGLPLSVFSMFGGMGLVMLSGVLCGPLRRWLNAAAGPLYAAFCVMMLAGCAWVSFRISPNTYLLSVDREQMPQFCFAKIIREHPDQSVLNYGFLDGGFYTVLDQVPEERAFCILNRNPDQMLAEQNTYVREGRTHFLVTWKAYAASEEELRELPVVSERYELVDHLYFEFEGDIRTYALYERRD
ncbi:MAG: hypothetical protein NC306_05910 [Butyrivibrio sp.]|nr:hypothetical protein [Butyrivibrio sp.]